MADTACVVCGEPWDVHHINHDMPLWKNRLFRAGKGCECCEGVPPKDGVDVEAAAGAILLGGDDIDPMPAICALEDGPKDHSALWVTPPPRVLATCEGCDAKVEVSEDEIYPYSRDGKQIGHIVLWTGGSGSSLGKRHDVPLDEISEDGGPTKWHFSDIDIDLNFSKQLGKMLCKDCWGACEQCNAVVFEGQARDHFCGDTYDAGNSFYVAQLNETLCIDCLEKTGTCEGCEDVFHNENLKDGRCEYCQKPERFECTGCHQMYNMDEAYEYDSSGALCDACGAVKSACTGRPHLLRPGKPETECGLPREEVDFFDYVEAEAPTAVGCWGCVKRITISDNDTFTQTEVETEGRPPGNEMD